MAAMVLLLMAALTCLLIFINIHMLEHYEDLQISKCESLLHAESMRISRGIGDMEDNVCKLALIGCLIAKFGGNFDEIGKTAVLESFPKSGDAIGGGIFYEPDALIPNKKRVCYYAFRNEVGDMIFDEKSEGADYDYLSQEWYKDIKSGILNGGNRPVWTKPYVDTAGTKALMTTVGFGIYKGDKLIGIATGDWVLTDISKSIASIKPTQNSRGLFLYLDKGIILAYSGKVFFDNVMDISQFPWVYSALNENMVTVDGVKCFAFSDILSNGMAVVSIVPRSELFHEITNYSNTIFLVMITSCVVIALIVLFTLSLFINRPLAVLARGFKSIASGAFETRLDIATGDEFQQLGEAVNSMASRLDGYIKNLTKVTEEKERIGAELNIATTIQKSMMPSIFPLFENRADLEMYAFMLPAKEVGGDFYDFFFIDEDTLALVIADVSGKGVPAALFMVIAKTLIKNTAQAGKSPGGVFYAVNNLLNENNTAKMFVTCFMAYLNIKTGILTCVNAGHIPPLITRGGAFEWLKIKSGLVLAGRKNTEYIEETVLLQKGDKLFMYTDGVTEAANKDEKLWGQKAFIDSANKNIDMPLKELTIAVKRDIDVFAAGAEQSDDIAMLVLIYEGDNK